MNPSMKILLWKEWRENGINFLFSVIVLIILRGLMAYLSRKYYPNTGDETETFIIFSLLFCSVYGLIMGVGMFAMEYTSHTFPYLRTRPIYKKEIYYSKHLMAIFQFLGLTLIILLLSFILDMQVFNKINIFMILLLPIFPMLFYIVSVFCSLVFKDMTRSTVISMMMSVITLIMIIQFSNQLNETLNKQWLSTSDLLKWTTQNNLYIFLFSLLFIILYGIINTILFYRQEVRN